jgi:hypothetical protein
MIALGISCQLLIMLCLWPASGYTCTAVAKLPPMRSLVRHVKVSGSMNLSNAVKNLCFDAASETWLWVEEGKKVYWNYYSKPKFGSLLFVARQPYFMTCSFLFSFGFRLWCIHLTIFFPCPWSFQGGVTSGRLGREIWWKRRAGKKILAKELMDDKKGYYPSSGLELLGLVYRLDSIDLIQKIAWMGSVAWWMGQGGWWRDGWWCH